MVNERFRGILEQFTTDTPGTAGHELAINEYLADNIYRVSWEPGDLLYVNNTAIVHGRAYCTPVPERPVSDEVPVVRMELGALATVQ